MPSFNNPLLIRFDFNIYSSGETEIDIVLDINKIFNPVSLGATPIDIISQPATHTFDGQGNIDPLAIRFFENVVDAISIVY